MNRRSFLGRLAAGVVGACALAKIPASWIPEPIVARAGTYGAIDRATFSFWRNQTVYGDGTLRHLEFRELDDAMRHLGDLMQ